MPRAAARRSRLYDSSSSDPEDDLDLQYLAHVNSQQGAGGTAIVSGAIILYGHFLQELNVAVKNFWVRRNARRRLLKQLAEECSRFGPMVRKQAAEMRASDAKRRLELLKAGDMDAYAALVQQSKDHHIGAMMEETAKILQELNAPTGSKRRVEQPSLLRNVQLMPHQLEGLTWLANLIDNRMTGGILADDMGLGKTIQTLSLLGHLKEKNFEEGPHLILVPLSTLSQWADSLANWLPDFKFRAFRAKPYCIKTLQTLQQEVEHGRPPTVNVVVTTYDLVYHHAHIFAHIPWSVLVVDEGHKIKNSFTKLAQIVKTIPCQHRILLTGTPIQNSLRELWSLLAFVAPSTFGSLDDFEQWFALPAPPSMQLCDEEEAREDEEVEEEAEEEEEEDEPVGDEFDYFNLIGQQTTPYRPPLRKERSRTGGKSDVAASKDDSLSQEEELLVIQRLHRVLKPFLLRRTKDMILNDLPKKTEVVIWTPLSSWQSRLYQQGVSELSGTKTRDYVASFAYLRQVLNHPYHVLDGELPTVDGDGVQDRLIQSSGKFELLDRLLPRLIAFQHKVLIFAQMTSLLDLLELLLARHGILFERIDGNAVLKERQRSAKSFQTDPKVSVMLLTTRAGGVGLNLQAADTVILLDSDWNPQVDLQAMDRAHRIGQWKPVVVLRLMSPVQMDRGLLRRAHSKISMEQKVIGAGRFCAASFASEEAQKMVLEGIINEARLQEDNTVGRAATPLEDINRMIARSWDEQVAFDHADLELLGPPAATASGGPETTEQRLSRSGRLLQEEGYIQLPAFKRLRLSSRGQ